jgi:predicted transcriptional regulator
MTARVQSVEAYRTNTQIGTQAAAIMRVIEKQPRCTRRQVAKKLKLETAVVSARVNWLIEKQLVTEDGEVTCPITSKKVAALKVISLQQDLFA